MTAPSVHPLNEPYARTQIEEAIRNGGFTPFLGAGASSLRPAKLNLSELPWSAVKAALLAIRSQLTSECQASQAAYHYLRSFTEQTLRVERTILDEMFPLTHEGEPDWSAVNKAPVGDLGWPSDTLLQFQKELVSLAANLSRLFGYSFSVSYPSLRAKSDLIVQISCDDSRYEELVQRVIATHEVALQLPKKSTPKPFDVYTSPKFQADLIQRKLAMLALELITEDVRSTPAVKEWLDKHENIVHQGLASGSSSHESHTVEIRLSRLQWLSDLFWYTLRNWIAQYPTTSELAFDLSLRARHAEPRIADLAQAAEAIFLDRKNLAHIITSYFKYCESRRLPNTRIDNQRVCFHLAIAAVLQEQYCKYRELQRLRRTAGKGVAAHGIDFPDTDTDSSDYRENWIPLAISTNFDRSLERAFEQVELPYHTVHPVRPKSGDRMTKEVQWLLCTWTPQGGHDTPFTCPAELDSIELKGPVIVKLHGSPLSKRRDNHESWLVLSELGYLEALDPNNKPMPPWLKSELTSRATGTRSLWFLGYSVSDWNVRLRLYEHLCEYRESQPTKAPTKGVVDKRAFDLFRSAILGTLKIERYTGDLNDLPALLVDALQAEGMKGGYEVERLLTEIKELGG